MKRLTHSVSERVEAIILYRDDVEEIIRVLKTIDPPVALTISGNDYQFENETEWSDLKIDRLRSLRISAQCPDWRLFVEVDEQGGGEVFLSDDSAVVRGVYEQIRTVLKRCWKQPFILQFPTGLLAGVTSGAVMVLLFVLFKDAKVDWWAFVLAFLAAIILPSHIWLRLQRSFVVPKYRNDSPGFWQRNSDKIFLAVIAAIIGSMVTLGVNRLMNPKTQNPNQTAPGSTNILK